MKADQVCWDDFSVVAPYLNDSVMHVKTNSTIRIFSPAKVNLLLAVTGKRADGFHNLVSLVTPITFGDYLEIRCAKETGGVELDCSDPEVPEGPENIVVQAAQAFRQAVDTQSTIHIRLEKNIPMEAGLGGGSSNAAMTLLALNECFGGPLKFESLRELAAQLGSDCPLFLKRAPVIMRGRGELLEPLTEELVAALEGRVLAIFKPGIGIMTPWAYGALSSREGYFADPVEIENQVAAWKSGERSLNELLFNSFERPVFEKYVAFPALFEDIRSQLGLCPLMSGSGSTCFVLLPEKDGAEQLQALVQESFGESCFFEICQIGTVP